MKKALAFLTYLILSVSLFAGGISGGGGGGSGSASDATLTTSDITTNDVSIIKHGFAPKAPNDATKYLNGLGAWAVPSGSSFTASSTDSLTNKTINDITNFVDANATHTKVYNGTGVQINKGQALYVVGWNAGNSAINVGLARANSASTMPCIGLAEANIAIGAVGEMRTAGTLTGLNTSTFSTADKVYVSTSTAGGLTNVEPTTNAQLIGIVGNQHASAGTIEIARDPESESYTGTGSYVKATSPTLVTPVLGTPSSGTLTNCTGLPVGGISATGTPGATNYLRGDGSWQTPASGGMAFNGVVAAGADTQGSVTLSDGLTYVSLSGAIGAVTLPSTTSGKVFTVFNADAAYNLKVYPPSGKNIQPIGINNFAFLVVPLSFLTFTSDASSNYYSNAYTYAAYLSGNMGVNNLNSGTGANSGTFWRGDGAWASPLATSGVSTYNHFDNPDFQVSQVGGSSPATVTAAQSTDTAHWVDRWRVRNTSGSSTVNTDRIAKTNYTLPGSKSNFVTRFTGGNSGNTFALYQRFTADQTKKMGPKLSMSFWIRTVCSVSAPTAKILMKTPSALNNFGTVAIVNEAAVGYSVPAITRNTWTQVTYTIGDTDASAWSNYPNGMQVELELTIPAGDSSWEVAVADFQLNNGTSAATFVNPTNLESYERCKFFYWKSFPQGTAPANNAGQTGALVARSEYSGPDVNSLATTVCIGPMFGTPTPTFYNPRAGTAGQWCSWNSDTSTGISGSTFSAFSNDHIIITGGSGTASVASYGIHLTLDSRL